MNRPPEVKRAAPGRATRYDTTPNCNDTAASHDTQAFIVYCIKATGARAEFQRYTHRDGAECIASRLRAVGCPPGVEALP